MLLNRMTKWMARVAAASATLLVSTTASAQSCAMCYNNAAAAKANGIRALQSGTIILLIPPMLMFIGIFAVAFRSRTRFNDRDFRDEERGQEGNEFSARLPAAAQGGFEPAPLEVGCPAP